MRTPFASLLSAIVIIAAGCHHVGRTTGDAGNGDVDSDVDGDVDSDSDGDTDTDTDADTDTGPVDCEEVPSYCCAEGCPCDGSDLSCVFSSTDYEPWLGTCHPPAPEGECWSQADCGEYQFCFGAFACPCNMDCDWEGPGQCLAASTGCCDPDDPDVCGDGYFCMDIDNDPTCHGLVEDPVCWTQADCTPGDICIDAQICSCMANCASSPGHCGGPD